MSHGASTVTKATQSAAKGGLSQAEVWEKASAIQKVLSGFRVQFDMLDEALRAFAPWAVMCPNDVDFPAIQKDCKNSSSLYESAINELDNQTSLRNNAMAAIAQFTSQCVLSEFHRLGSNIESNISSISSFSTIRQVMADNAETLDTLSSQLIDLQEHRKAEKKDKEFTAVGCMEKENYAGNANTQALGHASFTSHFSSTRRN